VKSVCGYGGDVLVFLWCRFGWFMVVWWWICHNPVQGGEATVVVARW